MRKLLAIGSLLLTSAAVIATPALARDRDDTVRPSAYTVQSRVERERVAGRVNRERREQERREVRVVRTYRDGCYR